MVQCLRRRGTALYGGARVHGVRHSLVRDLPPQVHGSDIRPDSWMAIAFLFLSLLGADVFYHAGDIPVMIIFIGLTLVYAARDSYTLISVATGSPADRILSVHHRVVAAVLHLRHHRGCGLGGEGLDLEEGRCMEAERRLAKGLLLLREAPLAVHVGLEVCTAGFGE